MVLDDVVVLNVDTNTLESPYEDLQSLPSDVVSTVVHVLHTEKYCVMCSRTRCLCDL